MQFQVSPHIVQALNTKRHHPDLPRWYSCLQARVTPADGAQQAFNVELQGPANLWGMLDCCKCLRPDLLQSYTVCACMTPWSHSTWRPSPRRFPVACCSGLTCVHDGRASTLARKHVLPTCYTAAQRVSARVWQQGQRATSYCSGLDCDARKLEVFNKTPGWHLHHRSCQILFLCICGLVLLVLFSSARITAGVLDTSVLFEMHFSL